MLQGHGGAAVAEVMSAVIVKGSAAGLSFRTAPPGRWGLTVTPGAAFPEVPEFPTPTQEAP